MRPRWLSLRANLETCALATARTATVGAVNSAPFLIYLEPEPGGPSSYIQAGELAPKAEIFRRPTACTAGACLVFCQDRHDLAQASFLGPL